MIVEPLPHEFTAYTEESPLNVSLYTVIEDSAMSEVTPIEGSRNKGETSVSELGDEIQLLSIDETDGALTVTRKLRTGYGWTGSISTSGSGGGIGFLAQKGMPDPTTFLQTYDGSVKPFPVPDFSTRQTLVNDFMTRRLYVLDPSADRLIIQRHAPDGTGEEIGQVPTGRHPSVIRLLQQSRLILVANQDDQTISVFSIDDEGVGLTLQETVATESFPIAIMAASNERFIYT